MVTKTWKYAESKKSPLVFRYRSTRHHIRYQDIYMKRVSLLSLTLLSLICNTLLASNGNLNIKINNEISHVDVKHNGKPVRIQREQSLDNTINPDYAKTSRKCPPFCIQPGKLARGVETIGELEVK